jgi:hypothetical protein
VSRLAVMVAQNLVELAFYEVEDVARLVAYLAAGFLVLGAFSRGEAVAAGLRVGPALERGPEPVPSVSSR